MAGNPEAVLAEALIRIEHKVDLILEVLKLDPLKTPFVGSPLVSCPLCKLPVQLGIDLQSQVAFRRCGCSSGKVPSTPLTPEPSKEPRRGNASISDPAADAATSEAEDVPSRKARGSGNR